MDHNFQSSMKMATRAAGFDEGFVPSVPPGAASFIGRKYDQTKAEPLCAYTRPCMMVIRRISPGERDVVADIITEKRAEIAALCRKYRVQRLDLFGSATSDRFDPETSDVDLLVDVGEYEQDIVYRYLDLARALEELLGHDVDLVTVRSVKSPLFRQAIEERRVTLYEQSNDQEAA